MYSDFDYIKRTPRLWTQAEILRALQLCYDLGVIPNIPVLQHEAVALTWTEKKNWLKEKLPI